MSRTGWGSGKRFGGDWGFDFLVGVGLSRPPNLVCMDVWCVTGH